MSLTVRALAFAALVSTSIALTAPATAQDSPPKQRKQLDPNEVV